MRNTMSKGPDVRNAPLTGEQRGRIIVALEAYASKQERDAKNSPFSETWKREAKLNRELADKIRVQDFQVF